MYVLNIQVPNPLFSLQVVISLLASIIVPMLLTGIRLAFKAPHLLFGDNAKHSKIFYTLLGCLISPFQPLILNIREEIVNLKLQAEKCNKYLKSLRVNLRMHLRAFKKCELGLETVFQICGQTLLALYSITMTKTTEGLAELFAENPEEKLSGVIASESTKVFESKEFTLAFLILSTLWSCITCVKTSVAFISLKREYFPSTAKILAHIFVFCSLMRRVLCIVMYFSVPLGLFNLLRHAQSEQVLWDPAIEKHLVDNNGFIQFEDVAKVPWKMLNRWNTSSNMPPSYQLYTIMDLQSYFFIFWGILFVQTLTVYFIKSRLSKPFMEMTIFEKILHALENIHVGQCTEDWDHQKGTAKDHLQRKNANWKEYLCLSLTNYFFNFLLLTPLCILGKTFLITLIHVPAK